MKEWLFTIRWFWRNRTWADSRQKYKRFDKDLAAYRDRGVKPW